ncbi:MAG: FAD-dependent oxidoreductase [Anaerolineae bacterium]|nr:FAD-dependent oxidoreductase [Anaerolineae bacterium]
MRAYTEPTRQIPVAHDVDVLIVGGGPAGVGAALAAARQGARTLLIEQSGAVGGVATTGLMSHWTGKTAHIGIYGEILRRAQDGEDPQLINPEKLKTVLLEMLDEAGVQWQLYTFASDVILEGYAIKGIVTESKSGREAILARIVVDATGDGDIAAKAGVPYTKGREGDGKMQPATLMFKVGGVDTDRVVRLVGAFEDTYETPQGDIQSLAKQHLPFPAGHLLIYRSTLPGVVTCNMTNSIDVDGTQAMDLTRADYECRRQLEPIVDFLRTYVAGFEKCYVISSAARVGVRETRHFAGEYELTEEDILAARVFDDWVVPRVHFNFDVHNLTGSGLDETGVQKHFSQPEHYTIPYGCFVPQKVDNLYVAGRDISGTHKAHANFRVMPICVLMGQAVGIAAALCVRHGVLPRALDVRQVQSVLEAQGVAP